MNVSVVVETFIFVENEILSAFLWSLGVLILESKGLVFQHKFHPKGQLIKGIGGMPHIVHHALFIHLKHEFMLKSIFHLLDSFFFSPLLATISWYTL